MSNSNLVFGQYVPGKSYLYKIDPRLKIVMVIVLMVAVFLLKGIYQILGGLVFTILLMTTGGISIFRALKGIKPILALSLFVFVFQIVFNRTGEALYTFKLNFSISSIASVVIVTLILFLLFRYIKWKFIALIIYLALIMGSFMYLTYPNAFYSYDFIIYEEGFNTALFVFIRLIVIVLIAMILTLTTKPTDITLGVEFLLKPLKVIKINPEEIALIITIALRYIPTILEESQKIMDAQASRGADFQGGSFINKIKIIVSLLVPMFAMSFEKSDELADAMIARNYVPGKHKTRYHVLKWKGLDTFFLIFMILVLGGTICLRIFL